MANAFNQLSQEELRNEIEKIITRDRGRLANTNYSAYPGKTLSPMSSLTQRAQSLESKRSNKGMPYQASLNKFVNSPIKDISQDNIHTMLDELGNRQADFGRNVIGGRFVKQFGQAADPYRNKFESKLDKDIGLRLGATQGDIEGINSIARKFEGKKNSAAFGALAESSRSKNDRQQRLISDLYGYGQQKHGINNKILTGEKARFDAERNDPYERLQNLQQALSGINTNEEHPDLANQNAEQLKRALIAYGVDVSKPVSQWGQGDSIHTPVYSGKLVEPINSDMETSYNLAEGISPSYQDKGYASRKALRKEVADSPNSISKVINDLPLKIRPKIDLIEAEAKKKAKADMTALNAKYIKHGMYGGQSHIKSAADRMRELNDATLSARSGVLKTDLQQGIVSSNIDDINKIRKLGQYDQLANTEFNDMLGDIKRTNTTGLEKWKNAQAGNEQLYKAYQNEKGYQQPRLLGNAHKTGFNSGWDGGIGAVENYFGNQGIKLSDISDLQNRYNDLEKELASNRAEIKNRNDYTAERDYQIDYQTNLKKLLEASKHQDDMSKWWNTGASRSGDTNANWAKVAKSREDFENLKKSLANKKGYNQMIAAVNSEESVRSKLYRQALDAYNAQQSQQSQHQNNPPNILSTTGGYLDTPTTRVLNHPEILKRRMLNSQFNDYNHAKSYLDANRLSY